MSKSSQDFVVSSCLDRLKLYAQRPGDNEEQIKTLTTKLVTRMKLQDKLCRDLASKCSLTEHVTLLLSLLQATENLVIIGNVISILQDLLEQKPCKKNCMSALLANDALATFVKLLPVMARDMCPEHLLPGLFFIMAKLARKDSKFTIKARCNNGLQSLLTIMKSQVRHTLLLRYLMQIMKQCVGNATNCNIMVKEGIIPVLVEILNCIGRKPTLLLKLTLETLGAVTKQSSNVAKFIRCSGTPRVLHILEQWAKYDASNRKKICSSGLMVMNHVAETRYGQKSIVDAGGMQTLYQLCVTMPRSHEYDKLLNLCSTVLQKCLPQKTLPISTPYGPYSFPIPSSKVYPSTINLKKTGVTCSASSKTCPKSNSNVTLSSDDENNFTDSEESDVSESSNGSEAFIARSEWNKEDIASYRKYFQELPDSMLGPFSFGFPVSANRSDSKSTFQMMSGDLAEVQNIDFENNMEKSLRQDIYYKMSGNTRHVATFVKLAYPDLHCDKFSFENEPLNDKDPMVCRTRLLENLKSWMNPVSTPVSVAYDLDELNTTSIVNPYQNLQNNDESRIGVQEITTPSLKFESRFESGNLRKAIQVGQFEYELILSPDINSSSHYQWFYFEVSNMEAVFPYTFHIINCEKTNSQFNYGMKPLMFSVKDAILGRNRWKRTGFDICYYKNIYHRETEELSEKAPGKYHFTLTFSVIFPHNRDICYFAYHYPYTYTSLQTDLIMNQYSYDKTTIYLSVQELCKSLNGNPVPVVTITSKVHAGQESRPFIFLTGRVHPGESNSSWVMKGTIDYLLSDEIVAQELRAGYIFKIVPMLNPDGVINGSHRCDLTAEDLNRCWHKPCPVLQPTIHHTKALLQFLYCHAKAPLVYCDYHGHSRKKNIFLYGCSNIQSWSHSDRDKADSGAQEVLPHVLDAIAPAFSIENCAFTVEKNRESTARVTAWREFGIEKSYTMESSYCGCDQGAYKGLHIGVQHLQEMGIKFCEALHQLNSSQSSFASINKLIQAANSSYLHPKRDEGSTGVSDNTGTDSESELAKCKSAPETL